MEYIEVSLSFTKDFPGEEILPALLAEIGFESFVCDNPTEISAYIPKEAFTEEQLQSILETLPEKVAWHATVIADQNWNELWESNFEAVVVAENCRIRAPFHPQNPEIPYDIIIDPKMAFGTAHHETTFLMLQILLKEHGSIKGKMVLDMGCGTGVLAILASMMGAHSVTAIDNDEWAYRNTLENISHNKIKNIDTYLGDASLLGKISYDIIIANITRNILLNDMEYYCNVLKNTGSMFLSGFFYDEIPLLTEAAEKYGLQLKDRMEKNNWATIKMTKR